MHTKLKLEINLYEDLVKFESGVTINGFYVKLTVLDKDERFEANEHIGDYVRFRGDDFSIKSNSSKKFGSLNLDSIILPSMDKLGYSYTKYFLTDKDRYDYLKKLNHALFDWANCWWGFSEDSMSTVKMNGSIWEVSCLTVVKDSLKDLELVY